MFAQMLGTETLDAGETERFEFEWDDPASGDYAARAELVTNDAECEASTEFSV